MDPAALFGALAGDDAEAFQGADLLGMALGRGEGPGAGDLDEFVHFEVFYDGTAQAAKAGEAVPFLRARLCEAFEVLDGDLSKYMWHRDPFALEVSMGSEGSKHEAAVEPHLVGHLRTGDGAEDEWYVVHLLRRLTAADASASCRVLDADGELLLIEAALAAPRWMTPENAENRCWIRGGKVHLLPRPRPPEPMRIGASEALVRLRRSGAETCAKDKVQRAIESRLEGFPRSAVELSTHVARAVLPHPVARALLCFPQLVAVALDHLPPPPARELQALRKQLSRADSAICFDCEGPPAAETVCIGVRMTRLQYARWRGIRYQLGQRFTAKHWHQPPGVKAEDQAMQLGASLCAGLEVAYLQETQSATAALRCPADQALLPELLPWAADATFTRHLSTSSGSRASSKSAAARRAYLQQSDLEQPFRVALRSIWDLEAVKQLDLKARWRDRSDGEDWLEVSAEELDRDMALRQAEFDEFDRRRGVAASQRAAKTTDAASAEAAKEEMASMGKELAGLLSRASCLDGVEPGSAVPATGSTNTPGGGEAESDEDSADCSEGELDVLGMEEDGLGPSDSDDEEGEGAAQGNIHEYMDELDDQLETALDDMLEADPAQQAPSAAGLQLHSRHVRVHGEDGINLDVHAMEHVLASYCSENNLEPGPASLLLGELGLSGRGFGGGAAARPVTTGGLDCMD